jgi:hypothetical protein
MAVRFRIQHKAYYGKQYTTEIWDADYVGSVVPFDISGRKGFEMRVLGEGKERTNPVIGSEVSIKMLITEAEHTSFIDDLNTSREGRFSVRIYNTLTSRLFWAGVVLSDSSTYPDAFPYEFEIIAGDGLAALKDIPYSNAGSPYTGVVSIVEHILNCLNKLSYVSTHYAAAADFLSTSVDWWEATMPSPGGADDDPLALTFVDHTVFYKFKGNEKLYYNCHEVLSYLMTTFGARLYRIDKGFYVDQLTYRTGTMKVRRYDLDGTVLSSSTLGSVNTIDQNTVGALEATGQYNFFAPLSAVTVKFDAKERRNYIEGWQYGETFQPVISKIEATSDTVFRFTCNIKTYFTNVDLTNPNPLYLEFRMKLKVGDNYMARSFDILNYQVQNGAAYWSSDSSNRVSYVVPINIPTAGNSNNHTYDVEIMVPGDLSGEYDFDFYYFRTLTKTLLTVTLENPPNPIPHASISNTVTKPWLELYSFGYSVAYPDSLEYEATNDEATNTLVQEITTIIGDSDNPNTVGRLQLSDGVGGFYDSTYWADGVNTRDERIGHLLARLVLAGQNTPVRKLQGSFFGSAIDLRYRYTWGGADWVMLGGTWESETDTIRGEFVELKYAPGSVSTTPVKLILNQSPYETFPGPLPTSGSSTLNELTAASTQIPIGSVLAPLADNITFDLVHAGAITSLAVTTSLTAGEYQIGDRLSVVNPLTGQSEILTVTAASLNGDTAIAVSGTLIGEYPEESFIIRNDVRIPSGVEGQILRKGPVKWEGYGTAALSDGVVLTWTDAGGWAAAASPAGYTDEQAQDAVGSMLSDSTEIDFTYTDATPSLTAVLKTTGVSAGTYNSLTVDIKGRVTAATLIAYLTANQSITLSGDVTGSGTTAITTTIANAVVTFAKFQNLSALSVFARSGNTSGVGAALAASAANQYLRVNSAGTSLEWGTITAVTGAGAAGQVALFTGASTVGGSATFTYDSTNKRLQVSEQVTPGAKVGTYNADYGTITGSREWMNVDGSLSTNLIATIRNFRNVGGTGDNIFSLVTGGANGGDPMLQFIISGVETWSIGVDNSDADKLKIKPQASPGAGATGGEGITITTAVTPLVGINTDTPIHPMDVNGLGRALTWTNRTDATGGTSTFSTGAGGSPSLTALVCPNGNMMTVRFTSGSSPTAGARIINIVPPAAVRHANKIYVILGGYNDVTQRDIAKFVIDTSATTPANIAIKSNSLLSGIDAATDYFLCIHIMGHA